MVKSVTVGQRRNIAFCGHGSCGKTSLIDALLVATGAVSGEHSVDNGTSICDFDPEEKAHHHTVEAKVTHCEHRGLHFSMLDTPGYPDFIGQTIGALAGVDCAAVCINAHAGIEVNTRRVFHAARQAGLANVLIITRLDNESIDFQNLIQQIIDTFGDACALINVPDGIGPELLGVIDVLEAGNEVAHPSIDLSKAREHLIECLVEADEEVLASYLDGETPSADELRRLLPRAVVGGSLVPIFCVSSKQRVGLEALLTGLGQCAPSPDMFCRQGIGADGASVELCADPTAPLVARVFETHIDPFVQKLSYVRIYTGTLTKDQVVHIAGTRTHLKMPQILEMQGNQATPIDSAEAGQIVALAKQSDLHTGTILGDVELPPIPFPKPMVGLALAPKSRGDENKLAAALHKLVEEDATLRLDRDAQTSELVITGMSEFHLKMILERLQYRDKLAVETKDPKIPFRETIQAEADGSYRHRKQSGGRGQFGEVHIRMYPLPSGTDIEDFCHKVRFPNLKEYHYDPSINFLWVNSVVGGTIPTNFLPAIEKGFRERMAKGVIAGYQVQDVAVEVHFGKYHDVDSSEAAFKIAGSMAFRDVFLQAKPSLLEPIVKLDVTTPEASVGDIYSDMSVRGGRVLGNEAIGGGFQVIHCEVPLREVLHYNRTLSSMTAGQGSYLVDFSHYEVMPPNVQQQIMAGAKMEEEEEVHA